jgi:hypothetical protein
MPYKLKSDRYASQAAHRQRNFELYWKILLDSKCMDCGLSDPRVLEFDHRPGLEKKFTISKAVSGSTRSWALILSEIAKCDIVCSNCHKIRTMERGNFSRQRASVD